MRYQKGRLYGEKGNFRLGNDVLTVQAPDERSSRSFRFHWLRGLSLSSGLLGYARYVKLLGCVTVTDTVAVTQRDTLRHIQYE